MRRAAPGSETRRERGGPQRKNHKTLLMVGSHSITGRVHSFAHSPPQQPTSRLAKQAYGQQQPGATDLARGACVCEGSRIQVFVKCTEEHAARSTGTLRNIESSTLTQSPDNGTSVFIGYHPPHSHHESPQLPKHSQPTGLVPLYRHSFGFGLGYSMHTKLQRESVRSTEEKGGGTHFLSFLTSCLPTQHS